MNYICILEHIQENLEDELVKEALESVRNIFVSVCIAKALKFDLLCIVFIKVSLRILFCLLFFLILILLHFILVMRADVSQKCLC